MKHDYMTQELEKKRKEKKKLQKRSFSDWLEVT
jgi:hypothetical protein